MATLQNRLLQEDVFDKTINAESRRGETTLIAALVSSTVW